MNLDIRPARPEDAEAAVPLIYSSGPAAFDFVFSHNTKTNALDFLRRAFRRKPSEFGYGMHYVVELDGDVVGAGGHFSGDDALSFSLHALRNIIGCYGPIAGAAVIRRGLQIEQIVKLPARGEHYIAHLGVTPDLQSRGVGRKLVEFLLNEGRKLGRRKASLDVSCENPRAQALYERMGFVVTEEIPSNLQNAAGRVPAHRRMELTI